MDKSVIGVLHPGEMGAAVGRLPDPAWAHGAVGVGRAQPRHRGPGGGSRDARCRHGRRDAGQAEVILSVCPPHAALEVARSVAGFRGIYVDANAMSPAHRARGRR